MEDLYLNKKENLVISIVASKSNTGKTTLIEGVIRILKQKNYSVGVLKHDAHKFDIDKKGKDSYRFTQAGADNVIISSSEKLAMVQIINKELEINDILKYFNNLDIILIEGYKNNNYPKIEVHRKSIDNKLLCQDSNFNSSSFIAVASDEELNIHIPLLDLDDINSIANFIEERYIKRKEFQ